MSAPKGAHERADHGANALPLPAHLIVEALNPACFDVSPIKRVHTYHAVVLCTAGEGDYEAQALYTVRAGDVYIVPAGTPHALRRVDGLMLWGVGFCPTCFAAQGQPDMLALFERVRGGAVPVACVGDSRRRRLEWLLRTLKEEVDAAHDAYAHGVQLAALTMILGEVARASPFAETPLANAPLVAQALALIERRCLEPLSLRDVAEALSRSPSHLTARVREVTGKTVQAWIIAGRMGEARRRLLQTDERVDVIAERVGYADVTHFIRLFRRDHDMTPAAWRRLHQRRS